MSDNKKLGQIDSNDNVTKNTSINDFNIHPLLYKEGLWMYFDSIKDKFFNDRTKVKTLLYILSQKNEIEFEYSESLKYLYNQYISQFDNNKYDESSLNKSINTIISNLKDESELYSKHTIDILDNIIKPLEGFVMNQCEIFYELIDLMKGYDKEFKITNQKVIQKMNNFHQGEKSVEAAMNKLEMIKNKIYSPNENEKNNQEDENEDNNEYFEKYSEIVKNNVEGTKILQNEYIELIKKANEERDNYIKLCNNIYDKVQKLDEDFLKMMKKELKLLVDKDNFFIENKQKIINLSAQSITEINIENDINNFINSKMTKFPLPPLFEYVEYSPDIILRNRKGETEIVQHQISINIINKLKQIFKNEKTKNELEEENINFINDTVYDIWEGNDYNMKKLEILFKEHKYRIHFLNRLNQYRIEGIFILKNQSFQNFCMVLSPLLNDSIKDEDYECIKLIMILSQTFYLEGEKKIMLQSGITLNEIWQNKKFWIGIIDYAIHEEINISKGYTIFLEEGGKEREKRVESAVISNLITFFFNMKLFGYPDEDSKVVINEYISKYNIDSNLIYSTNVSIKEIKNDIISNSIDNIIINDLTNDKSNTNSSIKRENTIDSKDDEKSSDLGSNHTSKDNSESIK